MAIAAYPSMAAGSGASFERSSSGRSSSRTPEPRESAITDAVHDRLELTERGRRRGVKHDAAVGIADEDTIEHHHVHVQ